MFINISRSSYYARCDPFVVDNPESDIAGANGAGWKSILVHTGVYDPNSGVPPKHLPTYQASDVGEAVRLALRQEMDKPPA